ncbi:hypothetical protein Efla_001277 [Eimeria flavescens]
MLRDAVAAGTELGKKAKGIMAAGQLVPDDLVLDLLSERLRSPECARGFILDGYPRNQEQATALQKLLASQKQKLDGVIFFDTPEETLVKRISGRRVHPASGRVYHTAFHPPKVEGKDDVTGEDLIQRKDDNEETLRKRLHVFNQQTLPLVQRRQMVEISSRIHLLPLASSLSVHRDPALAIYASLFVLLQFKPHPLVRKSEFETHASSLMRCETPQPDGCLHALQQATLLVQLRSSCNQGEKTVSQPKKWNTFALLTNTESHPSQSGDR